MSHPDTATARTRSTGDPLGGYGLQLVGEGVDPVGNALVPVRADSPRVEVVVRHASSTTAAHQVDDGRMLLAHERGVRIDLRRQDQQAVLDLPEALGPHTLVHPVLTMVASVFNRWHGRAALHGGAFVAHDRAFGVLGQRTDGKSTLLAGLSTRGVGVLTDDLVVVHQGLVLAGPGSVDLRPDAGDALGLGERLGVVGGRDRHRVTLAERPPDTPLGGFVQLAWSDDDDISVERLPLAERLACLVDQELLMGLTTPEASFPLLEAPLWRLRRPKDWSRFEETLDVVLELAASAG